MLLSRPNKIVNSRLTTVPTIDSMIELSPYLPPLLLLTEREDK